MERHMIRKPTKLKIVESGQRGAAGRRCKTGSGIHIPGGGISIPGSGIHIPGGGLHIRGGGIHIRGSGAFTKPHMAYGEKYSPHPYS